MGRRVAHAHAYRAVAAALGYITACARELGSFKLRVSPNSMLFRHPLRCTRDSTLLASTTTLSIVPFPFPFVSLLVSLSLSLSIYLSIFVAPSPFAAPLQGTNWILDHAVLFWGPRENRGRERERETENEKRSEIVEERGAVRSGSRRRDDTNWNLKLILANYYPSLSRAPASALGPTQLRPRVGYQK